jgi:hypothetical protein
MALTSAEMRCLVPAKVGEGSEGEMVEVLTNSVRSQFAHLSP